MFLLGIEKYRVHEVAKDFGLPTKTITEILTKYAETPKNHMQALTDQELSLIFEYLTQHNPVSSIQVIFADTYKEEPAKEPATKKPEPAGKAAAPAQGQQVRQSVPAQSAQSSQGGRQQPQQQNAASKPAAQQPVSRVPRQGEDPHQQPAPGRHDLLQQAQAGRGRADAQAPAGDRQEGPCEGHDPR